MVGIPSIPGLDDELATNAPYESRRNADADVIGRMSSQGVGHGRLPTRYRPLELRSPALADEMRRAW
jgi:hypothetical protein